MTRKASDVRRAGALALCFCISSCDKHDGAAPAASARPLLAPASNTAAPSASASVSPSPSSPVRCVTPESAGVVALPELKGEGANEVAAVAAARRELKRVLEVPEDYFGSVQSAGDLVLLELWPRAAFLPENCERTAERCTKCRTLSYDPKRGRVVGTKVWEQAEDDRH